MKLIDLTQPADNPDIVLSFAVEEKLKDVLVMGTREDGTFYCAGSMRDPRLAYFMAQQGAAYLFEHPQDWIDDE